MARSRRSVESALGDGFAGLSASGRIAVAYSGGLDSTVLLHAAVAGLGASRVLALHVHHGLQPAADGWVAHTRAQALGLGAAYRSLRVDGSPRPGDSVEHWARTRRYRLLLQAARDAAVAALLTAHHADDQLETLLLALARGCGLDGLTGLAGDEPRGGVRLLRPLLGIERSELAAYAREAGLAWVEDPTNADLARPRNAVRALAVPGLRAALPGLAGGVRQSLALLAEARATVDAVAAADVAAAAERLVPRALSRAVLAALPGPRQSAALRAWLVAQGAPAPGRSTVEQMRAQLVLGRCAHGEVRHAGWIVRRHRDRLTAAADADWPAPAPRSTVRWRGEASLRAAGDLSVDVIDEPGGIDPVWLRAQPLEVGPARSAGRLRLRADGPARTLKNLWQEAGVPPWWRGALPAVTVGGRLLAAAPFGMDRGADWPRAAAGVALVPRYNARFFRAAPFEPWP
jgi:tRNA(Ile)-lysidine synthase